MAIDQTSGYHMAKVLREDLEDPCLIYNPGKVSFGDARNQRG